MSRQGFPVGCPLPMALKNEVLSHVSNTYGTCTKICGEFLIEKTKSYREKCPFLKGINEFIKG